MNPTGQNDEIYKTVIAQIEKQVLQLKSIIEKV